MFSTGIPISEKILRTVLVYAVIAVLVRATGKRGLAGLNTLDIAVVFLLSNVVQNAIIGNDLSVTGAAVGAGTLVVVSSLLNRAAVRSPLIARIFDGTDTTGHHRRRRRGRRRPPAGTAAQRAGSRRPAAERRRHQAGGGGGARRRAASCW